jgi:8-oxo-dGTP diphosphatase
VGDGDATSRVVLVAACALIDGQGRVLITKRPEGKPLAGLWEFPGGKVEGCETPERALIRELHEELGITVSEPGLIPLTFASHAYPAFHLLMPVYGCRQWRGDVTAHEGQALAWVSPDALSAYAMPPADEPLKETLPGLLRLLGKSHAGE